MKVLKSVSLLFFSLIILSCSPDETVIKPDSSVFVLPDIINILEQAKSQKKGDEAKYQEKGDPVIEFFLKYKFTTESDYISGDNGCYTVNVRVYLTDIETGQKDLIANDDVKVGDCPQQKQYNINVTKSKCDIYTLENGDQLVSNNVKAHYCVAEIIDYEIIYNSYEKSINNLLKVEK